MPQIHPRFMRNETAPTRPLPIERASNTYNANPAVTIGLHRQKYKANMAEIQSTLYFLRTTTYLARTYPYVGCYIQYVCGPSTYVNRYN